MHILFSYWYTSMEVDRVICCLDYEMIYGPGAEEEDLSCRIVLSSPVGVERGGSPWLCWCVCVRSCDGTSPSLNYRMDWHAS